MISRQAKFLVKLIAEKEWLLTFREEEKVNTHPLTKSQNGSQLLHELNTFFRTCLAKMINISTLLDTNDQGSSRTAIIANAI